MGPILSRSADLFLDTAFAVALAAPTDARHARARHAGIAAPLEIDHALGCQGGRRDPQPGQCREPSPLG